MFSNRMEQPACTRVRAICPTRPSPIVIHRFILAQREGDTHDRIAVADTLPTTIKPGTPKGTAGGDHRRNKTGADGGGNERKRDTKGVETSEEGGTDNRGGGGQGPGGLLASPAWLFSSLPFHDDGTFTGFFVDVLQGSGQLARLFS